MKILKRNVSKDEFKKFLNNINLEDKNLYEEVTKHQDFIFQFSGGTASRMVAEARPENFDDMICLNSYSRPGASFGFGNFCLIKNALKFIKRCKSEIVHCFFMCRSKNKNIFYIFIKV